MKRSCSLACLVPYSGDGGGGVCRWIEDDKGRQCIQSTSVVVDRYEEARQQVFSQDN